ncbi:branched-chain amino acid ABC transporter permease [Xanthobacter dioxanivorans]|uniref:Branched-chain amino acid ABC transporter permease n=1 Tax=Xanthobacter dioxanivorans TaxID=2528964 RepID=A0A974PT33_9HYPH|nr:branched-chain amino acid ABC transporter permease [Xanthobacter dioxanivorans]QRG09297.1 branched-chain amino acid ABC transporter permease [Xanthobacter dioxanivorans]
MSGEVLLQAAVQGLQMGAIYALIALSMTLIFSVGGLLNFAHGDFLALAMYGSFILYAALKVDAYVAAPFMFLLFLGLGILLFRRLVQPVLAAGVLAGAQLTLGLVFVEQNLILVLFGGDYHTVPTVLSNRNLVIAPLVMPWVLVVGSAAAATLAAVLYVVLMRSDFGRQVRAVTQNRDAAALMGIRIDRIQALAFGLGIGLLGLTGPMIVSQFTLSPTMGLDLTLVALIVMVIGGIGNFLGSMIGGLIIGVAESLGSLLYGGTVGAMIPYGLLIVVLLFRPRGLLGER